MPAEAILTSISKYQHSQGLIIFFFYKPQKKLIFLIVGSTYFWEELENDVSGESWWKPFMAKIWK